LASRITRLAEYSFDVKAVTNVADSTGEIREEMVTISAGGAMGLKHSGACFAVGITSLAVQS
jgi:hypothetical protein